MAVLVWGEDWCEAVGGGDRDPIRWSIMGGEVFPLFSKVGVIVNFVCQLD